MALVALVVRLGKTQVPKVLTQYFPLLLQQVVGWGQLVAVVVAVVVRAAAAHRVKQRVQLPHLVKAVLGVRARHLAPVLEAAAVVLMLLVVVALRATTVVTVARV